MPKLSISGDGISSFLPGDDVRLTLRTQIFNDILISRFINFRIPKDPRILSERQVILSSDDIKIPVSTNIGSIQLTRYKSERITNQAHLRKVTIECATGTNMSVFKRNDAIRITATGGSQLADLNGNTYIIQTVFPKVRQIVINPTFSGTQLTFTNLTGTNSISRTVIVQHDGKDYKVTVDNDYVNEFLFNDEFRDIIIFAYSVKNNLSDLESNKRLMINTSVVIDETPNALPPAYSNIVGYEKKSVYKVPLVSNSNSYYIFSVAVARYKNVNGSWTPYAWVHKDSADKTIWKIARRA